MKLFPFKSLQCASLVHGVKKAEVMTIWPAEGAGADVRKLPVFRKLDYVISHLFCVQI